MREKNEQAIPKLGLALFKLRKADREPYAAKRPSPVRVTAVKKCKLLEMHDNLKLHPSVVHSR